MRATNVFAHMMIKSMSAREHVKRIARRHPSSTRVSPSGDNIVQSMYSENVVEYIKHWCAGIPILIHSTLRKLIGKLIGMYFGIYNHSASTIITLAPSRPAHDTAR
eukprot:COSAG01_NODE_381_length_17848_cov_10.220338_11_plen_106_part_00